MVSAWDWQNAVVATPDTHIKDEIRTILDRYSQTSREVVKVGYLIIESDSEALVLPCKFVAITDNWYSTNPRCHFNSHEYKYSQTISETQKWLRTCNRLTKIMVIYSTKGNIYTTNRGMIVMSYRGIISSMSHRLLWEAGRQELSKEPQRQILAPQPRDTRSVRCSESSCCLSLQSWRSRGPTKGLRSTTRWGHHFLCQISRD